MLNLWCFLTMMVFFGECFRFLSRRMTQDMVSLGCNPSNSWFHPFFGGCACGKADWSCASRKGYYTTVGEIMTLMDIGTYTWICPKPSSLHKWGEISHVQLRAALQKFSKAGCRWEDHQHFTPTLEARK